jgi:surfeit locus 1 family protein
MPTRAQKSLAAIFLSVTVVCAGLGVWQLRRLGERQATNTVAAAKRSLPAVTIGAGSRPQDSALVGRRLMAVGRFDYDRTIVVRGQALDGVPGVHAVTPLLIAGTDTALLVNRGFVPSPDAVHAPLLDSLRDGGRAQIEGIALPIGTSDGGQPITRNGRASWGRLDLGRLRDSLPYPIFGIQLRRTPTHAGAREFPRALGAPSLGAGPHLSYAVQWFGFAMVAAVFAVAVWRKRP